MPRRWPVALPHAGFVQLMKSVHNSHTLRVDTIGQGSHFLPVECWEWFTYCTHNGYEQTLHYAFELAIAFSPDYFLTAKFAVPCRPRRGHHTAWHRLARFHWLANSRHCAFPAIHLPDPGAGIRSGPYS